MLVNEKLYTHADSSFIYGITHVRSWGFPLLIAQAFLRTPLVDRCIDNTVRTVLSMIDAININECS